MVRAATEQDLPIIMELYEKARAFMRKTGNLHQWTEPFPKALLIDDIQKERLFTIERNNRVCGVFYFYIGEDPTYHYIEGEWLDSSPYGTIHRITGAEEERGIFKEAFEFCKSKINHLRIDTHEDNKIMQHTVEKHGYKRCGIIYLENGDPRLAYEFIEN